MDTLTVPDLELIKLLDFEPEFPCEVPQCSRQADFIARCRCCRFSMLICAEHIERDRRLSLGAAVVSCKKCGRAGRTLDDLIEFIPLDGAR